MLSIKHIRENIEEVKASLAKKGVKPTLIDEAVALDKKLREFQKMVEGYRAEQNTVSEEIQRTADNGERNTKINQMQILKAEIKKLEPDLEKVIQELNSVMMRLPNLPLADVPIGKDESENQVIRKWGDIPQFDFTPKDHLELGEALDIIDVKTASAVSGSRFYYLKGALALMEFAIAQYVFSTLTNAEIIKEIAVKISPDFPVKPFIPVIPPVMIKPGVYTKMARLDPGQEEERFYLQKDDLYLVGSAEHTMGPMHMDETIDEVRMPLRYIGFSTSFRREAGSYGKDTKGILRAHQFDKLEMESFSLSESSVKEQDFFVAVQEYMMQGLKLPYQVMMVCAGDMGGPDARQMDIETWMPGQNRYRETHSADLMTDYQSRRLNTKVKRTGGGVELVHMNDATAFAIGRILIAILENYQQKDGSIKVPDALLPFMFGISEIRKPDA